MNHTTPATGGPRVPELSSFCPSNTKMLNRAPYEVNAFVKFRNRNELAGAMRDADVARAEHDRIGAERDHARRFGAEGHGARRVAGCLFEKLNQRRVGGRFEALVRA